MTTTMGMGKNSISEIQSVILSLIIVICKVVSMRSVDRVAGAIIILLTIPILSMHFLYSFRLVRELVLVILD